MYLISHVKREFTYANSYRYFEFCLNIYIRASERLPFNSHFQCDLFSTLETLLGDLGFAYLVPHLHASVMNRKSYIRRYLVIGQLVHHFHLSILEELHPVIDENGEISEVHSIDGIDDFHITFY